MAPARPHVRCTVGARLRLAATRLLLAPTFPYRWGFVAPSGPERCPRPVRRQARNLRCTARASETTHHNGPATPPPAPGAHLRAPRARRCLPKRAPSFGHLAAPTASVHRLE